MKYDTTLKELFQNLPEKLLELLIGKEAKIAELLPVEFPAVSAKRADLILRLTNGKIYHLELQSSNDEKMIWRMLEYFLLIYRQYQQAPIQIVLYVGNKEPTINPKISLSTLDFTYNLIDIRQFDANLLLNSDLVSDNILAVLCNVTSIRQTIRQILSKVMLLSKTDRTKALTQLLILTGLRGWKVITLEEIKSMPLTFDIRENEFLFDIFKQGRQEGHEEGRQEGRQEGQAILLQQQLEYKFGKLPQSILNKLFTADPATLQLWSLRIFHSSTLDEIFKDNN
ncbi:MAG: hypothetical protein HY819_01450 [Acidobacteria bacterium]|nr:hypothetical protein [Acidobacteriota bacterium]